MAISYHLKRLKFSHSERLAKINDNMVLVGTCVACYMQHIQNYQTWWELNYQTTASLRIH